MAEEICFYDQLFKSINSFKFESNKKDLWKIHQINLLMSRFKDKNSSNIIKNGLIIILAFFNDYLKDSFHSNNRDIKNLSDLEKKMVITILREEFIS